MKKFAVSFLILLLTSFSFGAPLKGGVEDTYIPKGFYGSWGVISKLRETSNPSLFNYESRDVWTLSGFSNKLILENLESGAYSEILIKEKSLDNKTLNFQREKTTSRNGVKTVFQEKVSFVLNGNNFEGIDSFVIKRYDLIGNHLKTDYANYKCSGVKFP